MLFFCTKFGWTVDEVFDHSIDELRCLLDALSRRYTNDMNTKVGNALEQYNIEKLKKMKGGGI